MKLAIIAAIAKNRVIGKGGKLPWHIPEDLKRFKRLTTGHTIVMGRKTWESIGKALSNRRNVVLTSNPIPGVECCANIDKAIAALMDQERVFVIGGAQVYADTLHKADELYLTFVDQAIEGDAYFPEYEEQLQHKFKVVNREKRDGYEFVDYVRID